jgi:TP901 family phage tail tape measure protein
MPGGGDSRNANIVITAQNAGYIQSTQQSSAETNKFADAVDHLSGKLTNLSKWAGKKLVHFAAADFAALSGATATAATFEKQMSTLNATAEVSGQRFRDFKGAVESAFSKFPVSRTEVIALTTALTNMGVTGTKNIADLTQTFIKLGAATGEPMTELANGLTQLSRLMGTTSSQQIGNYANALLSLSKNAGVSASGVLNFAQAIAPMARQAGIGQAAVLGISTAFTKAGADGYVAANTFNSMVSDITQLISSGSPELSKYANLIGVTLDQFKKMDKTTALIDIFNTISRQGPAAIETLNRLGYTGVRAQAAIQAVTQSGGLEKAVNEALGTSTNQDQLTKGSKAAMGGLADSLAQLRNQFTQLGTEIGTTFLRPIEVATTGITNMMRAVNALIRPFTGLIGLVGGAAGVLGLVGGTALHFAGLIGSVAAVRMLRRSGPQRAMQAGVAASRAVAAGGTADAGERALAGQAWRTRAAYAIGQGYGRLRPNAPMDDEERRSVARMGASAVLRHPMRTVSWLASSQSRGLADADRSDYMRSAYQARNVDSFGASMSKMWNQHKAAGDSTAKAMAGLGRESGRLALAFGKLGLETTKAGLSMTMGRVGRGLSAAGGMLFNPWAIGAEMAGTALYSHIRERADQSKLTAEDLNPLAKLNDSLGITTTKLADFASGVDKVTKSIGAGDWGVASKVSATDKSGAASQKGYTSSVFGALARTGQATPDQALAALRTMPISDARSLQALKPDLIKLLGPEQAAQVLSSYTAGGAGAPGEAVPDYAALGQAMGATQGRGFFGGTFASNASKSGKAISGTVITSLKNAYSDQSDKYGGAYADQRKLADFVTYAQNALQGKAGSAQTAALKELGSDASTLFGGKRGLSQQAYQQVLAAGGSVQDAIMAGLQGQGQGVKASDYNQTFFQNLAGEGGTTNLGQMDATAAGLRKINTGGTNARIAASGRAGSFALGSGLVQSAVATPGDVQAQYKGTQALAQEALTGAKNFAEASKSLQDMKAAINDTTDPLYQLADAAQQEVRYRQQMAMPTLSRAGQLGQLEQGYQEAITTAGPDQAGRIDTAKKSMDQAVEAQRQYNIGLIKMIQSTTNQLDDAWADHYLQQGRATEDFKRSQLRSQEDFGRQMARAAKEAAKAWLDPWQRVFGEYTMTGEALVYNLKDQNERIKKQFDELNDLKRKGLSTEAIQTLGLDQAGKAQQVSQLAGDVGTDPKLIAQINAEVAKRIGGVTKITQSSFNEQYQNTVEDFNRSLARYNEDFNRSMQRGEDDFARSISRSQRDLNLSLQEITGDYASISKQLGTAAAQFAKKSPDAANTIIKSLSDAGTVIDTYVTALAKQLKLSLEAPANNPRSLPPGHDGSAPPTTLDIPPTMPGIGTPAPAPAPAPKKPARIVKAAGGIATGPYLMGEGAGPELNVPLDDRGHKFMSASYQAIANNVVRQMRTAGYGTPAAYSSGAVGTVTIDSSTNFTGEIHVKANDPNELARKLEEKKRLKRLVRPPRATAAS